jgi:hypothetical protein
MSNLSPTRSMYMFQLQGIPSLLNQNVCMWYPTSDRLQAERPQIESDKRYRFFFSPQIPKWPEGWGRGQKPLSSEYW